MGTGMGARRLEHTMACVLVLAAGCVGGCQKPILRPDDPRSQYDRYDALRNERAETYVEDEYGTRRPNVRGRLLGR
ncbi:MAG: hypothetical protein FJ255_07415 [Phycisphaerae bacterium]|nr:hypothetical protein [Phycisphaerae bacterium]